MGHKESDMAERLSPIGIYIYMCVCVCVCACVCVYTYIYMDIYNGILLSHIKEYNNAICIDMGGPRDCQLSEVNQSKANIT